MTNRPSMYALSEMITALLKEENDKDTDLKDYGDSLLKISQTIGQIKQGLENYVTQKENDQPVLRMFQYVQNWSTNLSNAILESLPYWPPDGTGQGGGQDDEGPDSGMLIYYSGINAELLGLLGHIEKYYPEYFNIDKLIPKSMAVGRQLQFITLAGPIICGQKCELTKIALGPVDSFIKGKKQVSYRKLYYLEGLLREVRGVCPACRGISINCALRDGLIKYNFNYHKFVLYQVEAISGLANSQEGLPAKLNVLSYQLKSIRQLPTCPGVSYSPKEIYVKKYLVNWLKEEIAYLKKNFSEGGQDVGTCKKNTPKEFKVQSPLPVPPLSKIIRALIEGGVFDVKKGKIKETVTFFAQHLESKSSNDPSGGTFRNAYYAKDEETNMNVRDIFLKLAELARKGKI